ncbi:MAG TPA: amidohydrolase family protein [Vicinamibacterales bacterium]|nr:amidohydrolase family protein [Vicinamibacterales bacterium]
MKFSRRHFLHTAAAAGGGLFFCPCALMAQAPTSGATARRQVLVGGQRVRTVDMHAHVFIDEAWPLVKDFPQTDKAMANLGASPMAIDQATMDRRFREMDRQGIDVHVISVHPSQFLYFLQPELAARIVKMQNEKIAALVAAHKDRFVGFGNISLQQPDLAVEQLDYAVKQLDLRGFIVGANVNGGELANPKLDPVWKKVEELQTVVMIHPQGFDDLGKRLEGAGALGNNIGFPLDTTIALAHLIFEGVLDRFPNVKFIGAHGGGFLASYIGRFDNCNALQAPCQRMKRKPSDYLRGPQLYFDSLVYSPQNLRNVITAAGASQVVIGTDFGFPIASTSPVDTVLQTPGLSAAEQRAILGETAARLIRL